MKPCNFPESTITLTAAPGDEDRVGELRIFKGEDPTGTPISISCFELEEGELELIKKTGKVWLWVTGSGAHPPVAMSAGSPFGDFHHGGYEMSPR